MSKDGIIAGGRREPPLRAPYNFVRLNETVLPTPWKEGRPSHATPIADHLSGEIEVAWRVETPLLVGGVDNDEPCRYGKDGRFVIPGASLRGLTRATLEIATYARLAFVDDQLFGLRDFDSVTWQGVIKNSHQQYSVHNIEAGWLKKVNGEIFLSQVRYGRFAIADLCAALTNGKIATNFREWQEMPLSLRRSAIRAAGLQGKQFWIEHPGLPATKYEKQGYRLGAGDSATEGYLVVAGAADRPGERGSNKKYETVFFGGFDDERKQPVNDAAWQRFKEVQIEDGRRHGDSASTNWSYLKPLLERGEAIPVFFVGEPGSSDLAISLTRLMRVPYQWGVHDLAKRTQPAMTGEGGLDFVEALFGRTPEKGVTPDPDQPLTLPWKGRVFFRHAELVDGAPQPDDAIDMVTMQPKPSFYPYYLRPKEGAAARHPVDWSNPAARLAGRKRYPARNQAAARDEVVRAPGNDQTRKPEQESHPRFLPANPDKPLHFTSRIRLHNVSEVELGGLLFALTFGQIEKATDDGYRHMLGRAKGYGYGQIRSWVEATRLERTDGELVPDLARCLDAFKAWVVEQLGGTSDYEELPEIKDLLALAHAPTGGEIREHLRFPSIPPGQSTDAEAILKAYQRIKKTTSTKKGSTFTQDRRQYPGQGEAEVSDQPNKDAFLSLPRY